MNNKSDTIIIGIILMTGLIFCILGHNVIGGRILAGGLGYILARLIQITFEGNSNT